MLTGEFHPVFEPWVVEAIAEITPWWVAFVLVFLTHLGSVYVLVPLVLLAYWRDYERMGPWLGIVIGYYALMASVKSLNSAVRPDVAPPVSADPFPEVFLGSYSHATAISTTSFPSGNVMAITIVAGLVVLDTRVSTFRRRAIGAALLVSVVAYTRLALGVHYPVDVIGGAVIGLGYLAGVTWLRKRVDDETRALFAFGAVCAFVSLWLVNGLTTLPTFEAMSGSNRVVAFGAAVGGLLSWSLVHWNGHTPRTLDRTPAPAIALVAVVTMVYVVHGAIAHPLVTMGWSAIAMVGIVALPWVVPDSQTLSSWLKQLLSGVTRKQSRTR